jgi:hypothetical protein
MQSVDMLHAVSAKGSSALRRIFADFARSRSLPKKSKLGARLVWPLADVIEH